MANPVWVGPSFGDLTTLADVKVWLQTGLNAFPATDVPSALGIIVGRPATIAAAAELLVPKSMPMIFAKVHASISY